MKKILSLALVGGLTVAQSLFTEVNTAAASKIDTLSTNTPIDTDKHGQGCCCSGCVHD